MYITEKRHERLKEVVEKRQQGLTVILENIHDPHNLGAVLRTCDSVGIHEVYALYTVESPDKLKVLAGNRTSSGARKWVDIHVFTDTQACFEAVRTKYDRIYGTHLSSESVSVYDLDFTQNIALVFGNEHRGMSQEALDLVDGNFIIPQVGMTRSLNISVACAVTLYEGMRQRLVADMYAVPDMDTSSFHADLLGTYIERSRPLVKEPKE